MYYKLINREPVPCELMEWAMWFEVADRQVADDSVGGARISTVFLGIDHSHLTGEPSLFETMIFGGEKDGYQERSSTYDEALKMHAEAVALVRGSLQ